MDKETLSHYGWIVILVLILAVMLALASPFGSFIAGAIKSTTAGLFNVNQAALGSAGIDVNDMVFENCDHLETEVRNVSDTYTGDTCCKNCGKVMATGETVKPKIPDGATYYDASEGITLTAGEEFPDSPSTGDKYIEGDYEYRFNQYLRYGSWTSDAGQNGWTVIARNKTKTTYGEIKSYICNQPVNYLHTTFNSCTKMTEIPKLPDTITNMTQAFVSCTSLTNEDLPVIPSGVTNMEQTFYGCTGLTDISGLVIPSGVTDLRMTFEQCTSLTNNGLLTIPNTVTSLTATYRNCTSLTDLSQYEIPDSVTKMVSTFASCTGLTDEGLPELPQKLVDMGSAFSYCTSLVDLSDYKIPNTVTEMFSTFTGCTSLTTAPDLSNCPTSLNMGLSFYGCTSLTDQGMPKLPSRVRFMGSTFHNCTSLIDLSDYVINSTDVCTTFKGCTNLVSAPIINVNSSNWRCDELFSGCTSLTGEVNVNGATASPTYRDNCSAGIDFAKQNITFVGSPDAILDYLGTGGTNYCAECNGCCKGSH